MSDKEIQNYKDYSDKKYEKELELSKDKKAFLKKKKGLFVKNFEFLFNDLTSEQEKMVAAFVEKNLDYLAQRIKVRQEFSETFYLKMRSKEDVLVDFFLSHYSGKKLSDLTDVEQKNYLNRLFQMQEIFWKSTTEKQKNYFHKTLNSYKDELKKMAGN